MRARTVTNCSSSLSPKQQLDVFAQAYANRGDLWENSRAHQCMPETEGRRLHLLECFHKRLLLYSFGSSLLNTVNCSKYKLHMNGRTNKISCFFLKY